MVKPARIINQSLCYLVVDFCAYFPLVQIPEISLHLSGRVSHRRHVRNCEHVNIFRQSL